MERNPSKSVEGQVRRLAGLLERQRDRIEEAAADAETDDPRQFALPGVLDNERREREADRRHWAARLARLERELRDEPERIRRSYAVSAHRLEPVGLVYLWPVSG